ncbi:MAG: hypothetical protein II628_09860 [Lachnospiraceae bacterium]|nr:hypothetical protein [Lachnospiraceae bacterium]
MGKRFLAKALSALISLLTVLLLCTPAYAAEQPDYSRKGSVRVMVRDADGSIVPGGSLTVIPVADAVYEDGNNYFVFREEFADCGLDLEEIGTEESGAPELAEKLAAWAQEKGIEGREQAVDEAGEAVFEGLSLGLYLFLQKVPADGYESLRPFLVTVPLWDGERLVYDIEAGPKAGRAMGLACAEVPAEKVFRAESGSLPKDETFHFQILPEDRNAPMPAAEGGLQDPETGAVTVTHGAGPFSFGKIWLDSEDIGKRYTYTIRELPGAGAGITYDDTVYTLTLEAEKNEASGKTECRTSVTGKNGREASKIVFTNIYRNPSSGLPPLLPETGQLWWPVPVLSLAGLMLIAAGRFFRGRKE